MIPGSVKVVGFDCDGVMFDSSRANQAYYNHILQRFDMPVMSPEQFAFAHMHTVDETLAFLIRDAATLAAARDFRKQMSYMPFIRYMVEEPCLRKVLTALRPVCKTAVATNRTDSMDRVLSEHRLEGIFDLVVTAQDVASPKPSPDLLLAVLSHFRIGPGEMVYIGDSELDAEAARRARIPFIAYRNTTLPADAHIETLAEVTALLGLSARNGGC